MSKKMLCYTLIVSIILFITFLNVKPTLAGNPTPTPNLSDTVDRESEEMLPGSFTKMLRQGSMELQPLDPVMSASAYTIKVIDVHTLQSGFVPKTNFKVGEKIIYEATIENRVTYFEPALVSWKWNMTKTSCKKSMKLEFVEKFFYGINYAYILNLKAVCPGEHKFTTSVWYKNTVTSRSITYIVCEKAATEAIDNDLTDRSDTDSITGEDIDAAMRAIRPKDNGLIGYGKTFVDVGREMGINPLYIAAHTAQETGWGTSRIWREKNNPFGYRAFDRCPYSCAQKFPSKAEGIRKGIENIKRDYLLPDGRYYDPEYGPTLQGMNAPYATDVCWGNGISRIMTSLAKKINPTQ